MKQEKKSDTVFEVGFYYTEYGKAYIHAKNKEEAQKKLFTELEENGLEYTDYKLMDRDYGTEML
jgi:hypothetical protein